MENDELILQELEKFAKLHRYEVFNGFIMQHPYFSTNIYPSSKTGALIQITKSNFKELVEKHTDEMRKYLKKDKDKDRLETLFLIFLNKVYHLDFLYLIRHILSKDELTDILSSTYNHIEFPGQISNVSIQQLFDLVDTSRFMNKEENEIFDKLPDKIKIYRGLQGFKAKIKSFSWTLNKEKATWFARRWKVNNPIYEAEILKKDAYVYIGSRNEDELIVNPKRLRKIKKLE